MKIRAMEHICSAKLKLSNCIFIIPSVPKNIPKSMNINKAGMPKREKTLLQNRQARIITDAMSRALTIS